MTNIFDEDIIYLTEQEYSDSDGIITDPVDVKIYIRKAEIVIDNIIGSYGKKDDINQVTIFPVNGMVPLNIKKACVLITNCLYKNKDKNNGSRVILSETRGRNSVTYDTRYQDKYKNIHFCYTEEIHSFLKEFLKNDKTKTNSFFRT